MAAYAKLSDVAARLPNRAFTTTSKPTAAQVTNWLTETEAEVNGELAAGGIGVPVTSSRGVEYLRGKVVERVCAMIERAYVSGTDLETDDVAEEKFEVYERFLERIRKFPERMATILDVGAGAAGSKLSAYVTDNDDGKTIEAGDFDPERTRDEVF